MHGHPKLDSLWSSAQTEDRFRLRNSQASNVLAMNQIFVFVLNLRNIEFNKIEFSFNCDYVS